MRDDKDKYCAACFDGNYPVDIDGKGYQPIQLHLFGSETPEV